MRLRNILELIRKDFIVEIRQKYALTGVILFAFTTVFIIYKSFNNISPLEWNILLWLVVLFAGINAIMKSFVQEKNDTYLYYYTMLHPLEVFVSKLIYNFIFLLFLIFIILFAFSLFAGNPIKDYVLFIEGVLPGALGIAIVFTFVSAIANAENQNATLMSILSLPLVLPILLLLIKISAVSMRLLMDTSIENDLLYLIGIDVMLLGISLILYPELWRA